MPSACDLLRLALEVEIFHLAPRPAARPPRNIPGSRGSPPRDVCFSSDDQMISGLMKTCGAFSLVLLGEVDGHDALRLAELDRGKPDAGRVVHGLEHLLDQLADGGVDLGDRLGDERAGACRGGRGCRGGPWARFNWRRWSMVCLHRAQIRSLFVRIGGLPNRGSKARMDTSPRSRLPSVAGLRPHACGRGDRRIWPSSGGPIGVIILMIARRRRRLAKSREAERSRPSSEARMAELRRLQAETTGRVQRDGRDAGRPAIAIREAPRHDRLDAVTHRLGQSMQATTKQTTDNLQR